MINYFRYIILLLLLFSLAGSADAQDARELRKQGLEAYQKGRWDLAAGYLEEARKYGIVDDTLLFYLAMSKHRVHDCAVALDYFSRLSAKNDNSFPHSVFYEGLMYKNLGKYQIAAEKFITYQLMQDTAISEERVEQEIRSVAVAPQILQDTLNVEIIQPGDHINSPYTEFGAVQLPDGSIYFSSLRPVVNASGSGLIPREFHTNIYRSRISTAGYMKSRIWDSPVNHKRRHSANISFTDDGNTLFFTRCERLGGEMVCEIYTSGKRGSKWTKPEKLPDLINKKGYSNTHPFVTETSGQPVMYFSSNRPGGLGKMDLWYSIIQDGTYTDPVNLGPAVNTPGNEITPFYIPADTLLYFSSDWHEGLGGYDIFSSKGGFASWEEPRNAGYPLNTSSNDLYFVANDDGYSGYLTSNRPGSYFATTQNCCNDIFYYEFDEMKPDTLSDEKPDSTQIVIREAKKLLPVTLYFDNDIPRPAVKEDSTIRKIDVLLERYVAKEDKYLYEYARNREDSLQMISFFNQVEKGGRLLDSLVNYLHRGLSQGEDIHLVLRGYASPLTTKEYNFKLSKRRIVSLVNYLRVAENGMLFPYLDSHDTTDARLYIYQEPMGEISQEGISDNPKDKRNSVYSLSAARARKIVITDILLEKEASQQENHQK